MNGYAWLAQITPALVDNQPHTLVQDTGLLTNPVFVQDLAIWLPLLITAAIATWHRQVWGTLVTGAMLAMFVLESIGIATDQWFGSHAAPLSVSASMSAVPAFAALAAVTAVPLVWYCRNLDRTVRRLGPRVGHGPRPRIDDAGARRGRSGEGVGRPG
jgi:hypothetical protein